MTKKTTTKPKPLEVIYRRTLGLMPDLKNARTHSPEQIEAIRRSIRAFGFTNPILLRENNIIGCGHARWQAAVAEEIARVPTITLAGLTDDQWSAYAIADNKLPLASGWNEQALTVAFTELAANGFDLNLTGFNEFELKGFGFGVSEPEPPKPKSTRFNVLIEAADEAQQKSLIERFEREGLKARALGG